MTHPLLLGLRMLFVCSLLCTSFVSAGFAEDNSKPNGREIMLNHYEQMTTRNWRSDVVMELHDRSGNVQTRHLKRLSKTDSDDQEKFHLRYLEPPRIKNTTLLIIEHKDRESDLWFYLPAIKKIKRLSGSNLQASYMGTEFSYKDLKRENIDEGENRYEYIKSEELEGIDHFVVDAYPASAQEKVEQGYSKRRLWLRNDNYLASRVDFYDSAGDYLKTLTGTDMREVDKNKFRYFKRTMTNRKGIKTVLEFRLLRVNEEDPADKYFTKTYLKRM
jgi:hypothetical protein